jgi:1-acyl-sn-glycerol-3-phosphate acyltransferase
MRGPAVPPTMANPVAARGPLPRRSPWLIAWFRRYARRHAARHFHAIRLSRNGPVPAVPPGPLIVVLNHASWWDPILGLLLSDRLPGRVHYAPIEAGALARYPLLERIGLFGIEPGTARGARDFWRLGRAIVAQADTALWVTAQGRFADPRERPVRLMPGVGHLAARLAEGHVLPLALEYAFWNERLPEALARFGAPIPLAGRHKPGGWTERIAQGLQATQEALAREVMGRDPTAFEVLLGGGAGVGGVYDLWRRLRAALGGQRFRPEHDEELTAWR